MTEAEVTRAFGDLGPIEVLSERGRFLVTVVSARFEGMDEAERQHLVWRRARERFGSEASVAVEFIYTYSPSEWERLNRGEALDELQD